MKLARFQKAFICVTLIPFLSFDSWNSQKSESVNENLPAYKLVWADEFDKDGKPNSKNWSFEIGFVRNDEHQWYQEENAWCENGMLIIEARKEQKKNPHYVAGSNEWRKNREYAEYTSSSLKTEKLHFFKYGRFEMRAKIDISSGLWPAFWTLGVEKEWPSNGEIDIMEYYRKILLANIATGTSTRWKAEWFSRKKPVDSFPEGWSEKFHTWRMDWNEKAISLFVDDDLMIKTELSKLANKDGSGFNPFKQPHYILLDFAIGGTNGGDPAITQFPKRFVVDYVRVYQ